MSKASWIGQTIGGRYQIQELLGQGGMSSVYKANDPNLRRVVALKLIHSHLSSDPQFVRRFEEEAAAVAQLRHPNIIQVYDFNNDDDTYYIVFEFVPGESLQSRISRLSDAGRQMPVTDTIKVATDVSSALDYAHRRGMVHRDIKPANVMLNVQEQAILMDFGIVKIVGGDSHTATGAVMGTARYMSPEQIKGEKVDERTDLYAMGIMLFEMVGGRPPYQSDSAMTLMMMHINDPVPDLRQLRSDVPPDLVAIINKALAKDRAQRYQSAAELTTDLQTVGTDSSGAIAAGAVAAAAVVTDATVLDASPAAGQAAPPSSVDQPKATTQDSAPMSAPVTQPPDIAPPPPPTSSTADEEKKRPIALMAGIAIAFLVLVCIAGAAIIFGTGLLSGDEDATPTEIAVADLTATSDATQPVQPTATREDIVDEPTRKPTIEPTEEATNTPLPTETLSPTNTPLPTNTPAPTDPAGPFVRINGIGSNGVNYVVDYTTFGYEPELPGMHMHFFFNTVPPANAGAGATAETWVIYAGPSPFMGYAISNRPAAATQMCVLVANSDHTVQIGTGNCFDLP